ncbi:prepilin-type N-terminal cleavage/methylation domain-containing protein [Aquibacillus sp. 3ASR75-11]|uniref:Prepilin-type N-terminal cleavage/methylation domain-containing protein n=1 Tax=Terrihalobacillus insolitus TaxID=2950438 RepID=A0A9X3WSM4_9BACI|nr:competence type IV pilus minor pilin ComGD [Terrihalobacillus insolitus]MDC3413402.1 prepilin-type N-terminal cleavage/methylation domain-containing protein [Terrihalobacillus insolitus]MDC3424985.1 prepilin-type N-terminal cleavage/methylation domain-containing protein [Terrihalobacillus insolitus]
MNEKGFTLLEVVVVLGITVMLLFIGIKIPLSVIDHQTTKQFFERFQSDMLRMQQETTLTSEYIRMTIYPDRHTYEIRKGGTGKLMIKREIPEGWEINLRTLSQPLSFLRNGNIQNPGTFSITTNDSTFLITFPFGKARSYIVKQ